MFHFRHIDNTVMTTHMLTMQLNKENPTDVMEISCVFLLDSIKLTPLLEVARLFARGELDIYNFLNVLYTCYICTYIHIYENIYIIHKHIILIFIYYTLYF